MNTFGNHFRLTTFGESHGKAMGGVIDGCPAKVAIDNQFISDELRRRREGDGVSFAGITSRCEEDRVQWMSGVYQGVTLGTPIAFMVTNNDCRPEDYEGLQALYRPGHADYTYMARYGIRDHRGGGRSSGRETVARVVAGSLAKQILQAKGITISSTYHNHEVCCTIHGLPAGVGNPVFDRLNARLAYAMLSIPSAMAFAMGDTPDAFRLSQKDYPDQWQPHGIGESLTGSNHCGGIQGGISNGMPVLFHVGFHLPPTLPEGMDCRDDNGVIHHVALTGRHDNNHIGRLPVIVESMTALVITDLTL